MNIRIGIFFIEWKYIAPEADSLCKLPQCVLVKLGIEFRLSGEDDLQEFFCRCL